MQDRRICLLVCKQPRRERGGKNGTGDVLKQTRPDMWKSQPKERRDYEHGSQWLVKKRTQLELSKRRLSSKNTPTRITTWWNHRQRNSQKSAWGSLTKDTGREGILSNSKVFSVPKGGQGWHRGQYWTHQNNSKEVFIKKDGLSIDERLNRLDHRFCTTSRKPTKSPKSLEFNHEWTLRNVRLQIALEKKNKWQRHVIWKTSLCNTRVKVI